MSSFLSIVTTCHPDSRVMSDFFRQLEAYADKNQLTVDLVIVDDLAVATSRNVYQIKSLKVSIEYVLPGTETGQAASVINGFKKAKFENVLSVDPDMGSSLHALKTILSLADNGMDIVMVRRVFSGRIWWRTCLGLMFNLLISLLLGFRVRDVNSPMFLVKRNIIAELGAMQLAPEAYKFKMFMDYHHRMTIVDVDDHSFKYNVASTYRFLDLVNLALKRIWLVLRLRLSSTD